ncbi:hypothetical protein [Alkalibacterium subtropicum]|nr:hypothetical protein [Alkalibacterium subtropicum]
MIIQTDIFHFILKAYYDDQPDVGLAEALFNTVKVYTKESDENHWK